MAIHQDQTKLSHNDMLAMILRLSAENDALKAAKHKALSFKVTDKGGLSVYGLGRFPVTLYRGQWERLIKIIPEIQAFIEANADKLSVKS